MAPLKSEDEDFEIVPFPEKVDLDDYVIINPSESESGDHHDGDDDDDDDEDKEKDRTGIDNVSEAEPTGEEEETNQDDHDDLDDDEDDHSDDDDDADYDDNLVPWSHRPKFGNERMRKLGSRELRYLNRLTAKKLKTLPNGCGGFKTKRYL